MIGFQRTSPTLAVAAFANGAHADTTVLYDFENDGPDIKAFHPTETADFFPPEKPLETVIQAAR